MQKDFSRFRRILKQELPRLTAEFNVESVGIFGSYVRQEEGPESDLDLLVTFKKPIGLIRFVTLENYLSDLLGIRIDLVMKSALKPRIAQRILKEVVAI